MTIKATDANRLLDNARIKLPGALDGTIKLEIFNTLMDFFQATNIWTEDVDFAVTTANTRGSTTSVTVESGGAINRLIYVLNADNIQRAMGMRTPGELDFWDVPNGDETWTARLALTVTDPIACSGRLEGFPKAPDWILTKYHNGLLDGVLARMMLQMAKPYSNPKLATVHARGYANMRALAKNESRHQNIHGGQTWRFPQGFSRNNCRSWFPPQ